MKGKKLQDRMKEYENVNRNYLMRRQPAIIRIDGKAFHSFTKGFVKPYDDVLIYAMNETAKKLCKNIQGCKMAYVQSDEISLLLTDYDDINTESWFNKNMQKIVSVSASMATLYFNKYFQEKVKELNLENSIYNKRINTALFDSRVFLLPNSEVCNYFIWRQQDCTRNSIESVGRTYFTDSELFQKNCNEIQDMLFKEKNINWNDYDVYLKRGRCIAKTKTYDNNTHRPDYIIDNNIPVFSKDRDYIEKYV